ncbi:MAG: thioredoxin domain-containing protein [Nitrospiraceae bacterium]
MNLRRSASVATLFTLMLGLTSLPAVAAEPDLDAATKQSLEQAIEQYIRTHPEVIEQSLQALEARREAEERAKQKAALATHQQELVSDPSSPISGNASGNITLVEFFDYRCGYCKRAAGAVTQLQKEDSRVRVVYKDFPILGEASELAAKAALASKAQGKHQAFHEALLASKGEMTKESIFAIARKSGSTRIVSTPTCATLNGNRSSNGIAPWRAASASTGHRDSSSARNWCLVLWT